MYNFPSLIIFSGCFQRSMNIIQVYDVYRYDYSYILSKILHFKVYNSFVFKFFSLEL